MNILVLGAAGKTGREVIAQSLAAGTTWTIVYATRLTDEPRSGGYRTVEGTLTDVGTISRSDLADGACSRRSQMRPPCGRVGW